MHTLKTLLAWFNKKRTQRKINALLFDAALLREGAKQRIELAAQANNEAEKCEIMAHALMRDALVLRGGKRPCPYKVEGNETDNCF